jgi:two-component system response regulator PilR (NtrC family)
MPATVQVLLLRTLQDNVVIPVGASKGKRLKFRVISATNQSLEGLIKSGKFREDLYYRLRGVELEIPPLRERREDIPDLMTMMFELHGHPTKKLSPEALRFCESYKWPGNLRQLDKLIETMGEISDGNTVTLSEVENYLVRTPIFHASAPTSESDGYLFSVKSSEVGGNYDALITKLEQSMLRYALDERKSLLSASKLLGVNRLALRRRLKEWAWEEDRDQG